MANAVSTDTESTNQGSSFSLTSIKLDKCQNIFETFSSSQSQQRSNARQVILPSKLTKRQHAKSMANETNSNAENEFQIPSKKKTVPASSVENKYLLNLTDLHNRYTPLEQMEESEQDSLELQQNTKVNIPPIFLHEVNNYQQIVKDLNKIIECDYTTQQRGKVLKINTSTTNDFRSVTKFLEDEQIQFHTFQDPNSKKYEVVIRNVPYSLTNEEILSELKEMNLPVINVTRLLYKDKQPMPLCVIELKNTDEAKQIFEVTHLQHAIVSVEHRRKSTTIPQCTRCQRYGHTKNFCRLNPRCVKCQGDHHYSQCIKPRHVEPTCVNCGQSHSANYKGCPYYLNLANKQKRNPVNTTSNVSNTNRDTPSAPAINSENFPSLQTNSPTSVTSNPLWPRTTFSSSRDQERNRSADSGSTSSNIETVIKLLINMITPYISKIKSVIVSILHELIQNGQ